MHVSQFDSEHFGGEQRSLSLCGQHSTDSLTIHFASSKIFMFADIQMQPLKKHTQNPNGAVWTSQLPSVFALGCTPQWCCFSHSSPLLPWLLIKPEHPCCACSWTYTGIFPRWGQCCFCLKAPVQLPVQQLSLGQINMQLQQLPLSSHSAQDDKAKSGW